MPRAQQRRSVTSNDAGHALGYALPFATVFVSSFCVMVIEMVAGRMISGNLGASLYTWTSVIGVVLAGLSVGNYSGGRLADRFDARPTLALLFCAASASSVSILALDNLASGWSLLWMLSWPARVASHVALAFFLPSFLLGMTSPVVAKMALTMGKPIGRTIGSVYAWGVVGSILGTFTTGFMLVEWFGTVNILLGVAVVLAAMALLYRARSIPAWIWMACVGGLIVLTTGSMEFASSYGEKFGLRKSRSRHSIYYKESQYSFIEVIQKHGNVAERELYLDALLHSQLDMDQPLVLRYPYEKIFAAVTRRLFADGQPVDNLMIGGGGYVYPRYMEETYPGGRNHVVEIDPEVTKAARLYFGLPENSSIRSFHEDARVFVNRLRQEKEDGEPSSAYAVIYVDAFNHHSVPFQLTTLEFVENVHALLEPEGAFLINLIDTFEDAKFLGAMVNTVQEVFPHVEVFTEGVIPGPEMKGRVTFVLAALNHPLNAMNLSSECNEGCDIFSLSEKGIAALTQKSGLILTDDYAPVENLLASVVHSHSLTRAEDDWYGLIRDTLSAGKTEEAMRLARNAVAVFPESSELASALSVTLVKSATRLRESGETEGALAVYLEAVEVYPGNPLGYLGAIGCYHDLGRLEDTLALYEEVLAFNEEALEIDPSVIYNYATALAKLGRYPQAIEQFEKTTQESPEFADAYNNWGNTLLQLGDVEAAAMKYEQVLRFDPDHSGARQNLDRIRGASRTNVP